MKNFLMRQAWPVVAGLVTAFIVMTILEYSNSFFYPLPEGLNPYNTAAVQAFTASLPWTAYILVLVGWIMGAFAAGALTTHLSREETYHLSFIVGVILTILGIINNILIGHAMYFSLIGLPMFFIFTYLGHRYLLKVRARRTQVPID